MDARVLKECDLFQRNDNVFNPKQTAPTIGMKTTSPASILCFPRNMISLSKVYDAGFIYRSSQ